RAALPVVAALSARLPRGRAPRGLALAERHHDADADRDHREHDREADQQRPQMSVAFDVAPDHVPQTPSLAAVVLPQLRCRGFLPAAPPKRRHGLREARPPGARRQRRTGRSTGSSSARRPWLRRYRQGMNGTLIAIVVTLSLAINVVVVLAMFIWAARKDGE